MPDASSAKKKTLNRKQQRFVEEYCILLNATQAAKNAGYSEDTAKQLGSRLLTNVDVRKAVNQRMEAMGEAAGIQQTHVLESLLEIQQRCLDDEKFEPASALRATELLGKHLAMFTEKTEHTTPLPVVIKSDDADCG